MEICKPHFEKHLFVCENRREEGDCCGAAGERIRELLKIGVKDKGLAGRVRVSRSGCLDVCSEGPNVLLMPDNIWFKRVCERDIAGIIARAEGSVSKSHF